MYGSKCSNLDIDKDKYFIDLVISSYTEATSILYKHDIEKLANNVKLKLKKYEKENRSSIYSEFHPY